MSSQLHPDLAPLPSYLRNWRAPHFAALWIAISASIPMYVLGTSFDARPIPLIVAAVLGAVVTALVAGICGRAGAVSGVPFASAMTLTFGSAIARVPCVIRAVIGIVFLSTGCWVGAGIIESTLATLHLVSPPPPGTSVTVLRLSCLVLLLAINGGLVMTGGEGARRVIVACAPALIVGALALLAWGAIKAGPAEPASVGAASQSGSLGLAAGIVTLWLVVALTSSDFTRHAEPGSRHAIGQGVGIVIGTLVVIAAGAVMSRHGDVMRDPGRLSTLLAGSSVTMAIVVGGILLGAVITTTMLAHLWGTASCLSGASGGRIGTKLGAVLACGGGAAVMPWMWTRPMLTLVIHALAIVLTTIVAVAVCDQFVTRRRERDGVDPEENPTSALVTRRALIACGIGVAAALPALIRPETRRIAAGLEAVALGGSSTVETTDIAGLILVMGWPVAAMISVLSYILLMMLPTPSREPQSDAPVLAGV